MSDPDAQIGAGPLTALGKNLTKARRAERGKAITKSTGADSLIFPADLRSGREAVRFEVFKDYVFDRTETTQEQAVHTIFLPIPNVLQPSYSAQYSETELGVAGKAGADTGSVLAGGDFGETNLTGGAANLLASNIQVGTAAAGSLVGSIFGRIGLGAGAGLLTGAGLDKGVQGALFGAGIARNPHMAQVFQNVAFRKHSFDYKLAPKNEKEQEIITEIIRIFKVAMHPRYMLGNHMFDYPLQFDIDIIAGESSRHFYNIGASVLTDMSVNYLPNGPHMHDIEGTKAPIAVNMTLNFTEIKIVTQEDISKNNY